MLGFIIHYWPFYKYYNQNIQNGHFVKKYFKYKNFKEIQIRAFNIIYNDNLVEFKKYKCVIPDFFNVGDDLVGDRALIYHYKKTYLIGDYLVKEVYHLRYINRTIIYPRYIIYQIEYQERPRLVSDYYYYVVLEDNCPYQQLVYLLNEIHISDSLYYRQALVDYIFYYYPREFEICCNKFWFPVTQYMPYMRLRIHAYDIEDVFKKIFPKRISNTGKYYKFTPYWRSYPLNSKIVVKYLRTRAYNKLNYIEEFIIKNILKRRPKNIFKDTSALYTYKYLYLKPLKSTIYHYQSTFSIFLDKTKITIYNRRRLFKEFIYFYSNFVTLYSKKSLDQLSFNNIYISIIKVKYNKISPIYKKAQLLKYPYLKYHQRLITNIKSSSINLNEWFTKKSLNLPEIKKFVFKYYFTKALSVDYYVVYSKIIVNWDTDFGYHRYINEKLWEINLLTQYFKDTDYKNFIKDILKVKNVIVRKYKIKLPKYYKNIIPKITIASNLVYSKIYGKKYLYRLNFIPVKISYKKWGTWYYYKELNPNLDDFYLKIKYYYPFDFYLNRKFPPEILFRIFYFNFDFYLNRQSFYNDISFSQKDNYYYYKELALLNKSYILTPKYINKTPYYLREFINSFVVNKYIKPFVLLAGYKEFKYNEIYQIKIDYLFPPTSKIYYNREVNYILNKILTKFYQFKIYYIKSIFIKSQIKIKYKKQTNYYNTFLSIIYNYKLSSYVKETNYKYYISHNIFKDKYNLSAVKYVRLNNYIAPYKQILKPYYLPKFKFGYNIDIKNLFDLSLDLDWRYWDIKYFYKKEILLLRSFYILKIRVVKNSLIYKYNKFRTIKSTYNLYIKPIKTFFAKNLNYWIYFGKLSEPKNSFKENFKKYTYRIWYDYYNYISPYTFNYFYEIFKIGKNRKPAVTTNICRIYFQQDISAGIFNIIRSFINYSQYTNINQRNTIYYKIDLKTYNYIHAPKNFNSNKDNLVYQIIHDRRIFNQRYYSPLNKVVYIKGLRINNYIKSSQYKIKLNILKFVRDYKYAYYNKDVVKFKIEKTNIKINKFINIYWYIWLKPVVIKSYIKGYSVDEVRGAYFILYIRKPPPSKNLNLYNLTEKQMEHLEQFGNYTPHKIIKTWYTDILF